MRMASKFGSDCSTCALGPVLNDAEDGAEVEGEEDAVEVTVGRKAVARGGTRNGDGMIPEYVDEGVVVVVVVVLAVRVSVGTRETAGTTGRTRGWTAGSGEPEGAALGMGTALGSSAFVICCLATSSM